MRIYDLGEVTTVEQLEELEFFADGVYANSIGLVNAAEIDSSIAGNICKECGNRREYRPVYDANTYRAFSVCHQCDNVEEF